MTNKKKPATNNNQNNNFEISFKKDKEYPFRTTERSTGNTVVFETKDEKESYILQEKNNIVYTLKSKLAAIRFNLNQQSVISESTIDSFKLFVQDIIDYFPLSKENLYIFLNLKEYSKINIIKGLSKIEEIFQSGQQEITTPAETNNHYKISDLKHFKFKKDISLLKEHLNILKLKCFINYENINDVLNLEEKIIIVDHKYYNQFLFSLFHAWSKMDCIISIDNHKNKKDILEDGIKIFKTTNGDFKIDNIKKSYSTKNNNAIEDTSNVIESHLQ